MARFVRSCGMVLLVAWTLCILGACRPTGDEVAQEYRAAAKEKLKQFGLVLAQARKEPAVVRASDEAAALRAPGVSFALDEEDVSANARVVWLDAYDNPAEHLDPLHVSYRDVYDWWRQTSITLEGDDESLTEGQEKRLHDAFASLTATEYVLVVRTLEVIEPSFDADTKLFKLGAFEGEAHLYRMADAEHLGSFTFRAFNNPIGIGNMDFTLNDESPESSLASLRDRLFGSIHAFAQARAAEKFDGAVSKLRIEGEVGFTTRPRIVYPVTE